MNRAARLSILIADDQDEVLAVYRDILKSKLGHEVECVSLPAEALRYVRDTMFDVVVVDAKLPYKGAELGGLILADELGRVVGPGSVLLISQYDVRSMVAHFNPCFSFLPKPRDGNLLHWAAGEFLTKLGSLVRKQYGFVVMPFSDPKVADWYQHVLTPWMLEAGFEIRRMDQIATTRALNVELQQKIREAHFVLVLAASSNPNVYFEAGFAAALDKFILLFSHDLHALPFDIRANRAFPFADLADAHAKEEFVGFVNRLRGM